MENLSSFWQLGDVAAEEGSSSDMDFGDEFKSLEQFELLIHLLKLKSKLQLVIKESSKSNRDLKFDIGDFYAIVSSDQMIMVLFRLKGDCP